VDTAIMVLRDAGYKAEALYLAEKHAEHEWFVMPDSAPCVHSPDAPVRALHRGPRRCALLFTSSPRSPLLVLLIILLASSSSSTFSWC
jgi:hypothetical protein